MELFVMLVLLFVALFVWQFLATRNALAITRVLRQSLFEVTATDPATLLVVAGVLVLVALIAGLAPMRRAMRIDPMTALRSE